MIAIQLGSADIAASQRLVREVRERFASVEDPGFQAQATVAAQELPRSLRRELNRFRLDEPDVLCLITGYPLDEALIADTPGSWQEAAGRTDTREWEFFFFLCSCLLGDPVAWATQQESRIMHDVLPVQGDEAFQLNTCSEVALTWHTEDAFHPYRAAYVGLLCLRNPDQTETTIASAADLELDPAAREQLFGRSYVIEPDNSHRPERRAPAGPDDAGGMLAAVPEADLVAVMFGARDMPYLRLDPYFMTEPASGPAAHAAFAQLCQQIDGALQAFALAPGDVAFIDNFRAVHGRRPFKARYDGSDRWLKRLNITRDLRPSRDSRAFPGSRLIYPAPLADSRAADG
jgi:enduracididine beta-hydroxylase